ncbi:thiolase family protein [Noviherbaspirillum sedimenti]|uniref:Thiolase family protein n=1 Tax=Noviherbaspirillum sedimenti TaxID=2320865 RepID=A0A3A3G4L6_9BURK|nr:thiolase family protein [Noviherbaspirillum sedimenti]RJG02605.1 thiolase family protein [Noviherbaspirillum sedimenti]
MNENLAHVYLLAGLRTPFGRLGGQLAAYTATDLAATVIRQLAVAHPLARRPSGVLLGSVVQAGLGQNPARIAATKGGIDSSTPALTLNNVCLAGLEAVCDATRRIRTNEGSHYVVGGFDSMTNAPLLDAGGTAEGERRTYMIDGLTCALSGQSMGMLSDACNRELGISRQMQDEWAYHSHQRATAAANLLAAEMAAVSDALDKPPRDQGVRPNSSMEALSKLEPAFSAGGSITAGNASQMADGASIGIVASEAAVRTHGEQPLARIVDWSFIAGPDYSLHLKPAAAMRKLLSQQGLKASQIDLFEINEAFAGVAVASSRDLDIPYDIVNVNGGAIAIGHPLGGTGFRLLLTLAMEMKRRRVRRGIATLCGGGGQALAVLIERV